MTHGVAISKYGINLILLKNLLLLF
jgi:hypothetical protein